MKKFLVTCILTLIFVSAGFSYGNDYNLVPLPNGTYSFVTNQGEPSVITSAGNVLAMMTKNGIVSYFNLKVDRDGNYIYLYQVNRDVYVTIGFENSCSGVLLGSDGTKFYLYNTHPSCRQ